MKEEEWRELLELEDLMRHAVPEPEPVLTTNELLKDIEDTFDQLHAAVKRYIHLLKGGANVAPERRDDR